MPTDYATTPAKFRGHWSSSALAIGLDIFEGKDLEGKGRFSNLIQ
jgi:hypothetical protein